MSATPVPLKKGLQLYNKATRVNWLTSQVNSLKQMHVSPSKEDAVKWVVERAGSHFTIRIMNTKKFLAAGSPKATADCTAILSSKAYLWNITRTSNGIKIATTQPCLENGRKVVQFLKVSSVGGAHLELASKDGGTFVAVVPPNGQHPTGAPPTRPIHPTTTPAPHHPVSDKLRITKATQVPKVVIIEPYLQPRSYVGPKTLPAQGREGSLQVSPTQAIWFTLPSQFGVSIHSGSIHGPHIAVTTDCSRPILEMGALTPRSRFQVGTIAGYDGFILRTSTGACRDNKARFLVRHSNGAIGVGTAGPTSKTINQYLWRFIVGTVTPTPSPGPPTTSPFPLTSPPPTTSPFPMTPSPPPPTTSPFPYPLTPSPPSPTTSPFPIKKPTRPHHKNPFPDSLTPSPPTTTPFPDPTNSAQDSSSDMNINLNIDSDNPQVMFPYPVAPDLLLDVSTPQSTVASETTTTPAPTDAPTDPAIDDYVADDEIIDDGEDDGEDPPEQFWTTARIGMALVAFILAGIAGYYIYKNMNGSTNNSTNNTNNTFKNNTSNTPPGNVNTSTNANLGNLGGNDSFGDGFDDFANVRNMGPPPPTTSR